MLSAINNFRNKYPKVFTLVCSILIALITILFASSVASPIYAIFRSDGFDNDPQYFLYIGRLMVSGQKPYVDIYDHKGLYIFFYYYIAVLLGGKSGLFFLEIIFYSVFYYFFIKALRVMFENSVKTRLVCVLFFFIIMAFVFQGGTDIDPQLPFIGALMYFYFKGIKNKDFKAFMFGNIVAGFLAGLDINLRASDAIVPFSCVVFYAYYAIKNKQLKYAFRDCALCLSSLLLACIPPIIVSMAGGYFKTMFNYLFASNAGYVFSKRLYLNHSQIASYLMLLIALPIFVLSLIYLRKRIDKEEWMFYLLSICIVYPFEVLICLFIHYFLPMLTFMIIYFARVIEEFNVVKNNKTTKNVFVIASVATSLIAATLYPVFFYAGLYKHDLAIKDYIENETNGKKDNLLVIDYGISFYLNSNFTTKTKYFSSQTWHIDFEDDVIDELVRYITAGEIEYVVTPEYATTREANKKTIDQLLVKVPSLSLIDSNLEGNKYIDIYKLN